MRRSDIGPFGVVTVVLVLLVQVGAVAESVGRGTGWLGLLVGVAAGRAAVVWGCRTGVPAARRDGLGLLFAGALPTWAAAAVTALTAAACAGVSWLDDDRSAGMYVTFSQTPTSFVNLIVKGVVNPETMQQAISTLPPQVPSRAVIDG
jgi:adenosylcobinamide-GDP ribazoletransferase